MSNYQLLNNIEHKDIKVDIEKSSSFGNSQSYSMIFPFEFKHAQADYPIFFVKDKQDQFVSIALHGFEQEENLFLTDKGWQADYIPLMVEREPFLIGFQGEEGNPQPVIHIDMDNPRVNKEKGLDVFLPHGGNSDYINRISTILKTIHDNQQASQDFMNKLEELNLIESFNLDIQMRDGSNNRLAGFYTINEDKLKTLTGEQLAELNQSGMLNLIFMVIASHSKVTSLINKKDALTAN